MFLSALLSRYKWLASFLVLLAILTPVLFVSGSLAPSVAQADDPDAAATVSPAPPGASVSSQVIVPTSMRSSPFDVNRYLNIPPDFTISVYARIGGARFMAVTPDGNLLVSIPGNGKVVLVRHNGLGDPTVSDFVTGLRKPHDMVFHTIGTTTYLYISETHQINRYIWNNGNLTGQNRQIIITGLPDSSTPELHGSYGHELKNIALDSNHKLYVSIASTCNACTSDTVSDPVRGAVYQYNADGTGRRIFARGLRNAEGLAFIPGTNNLWVVVNNRDNIACPVVDTSKGCSSVGEVNQTYVDNHPPEEFTYVRDGGNYGWPFCNPNPDTTSGMDNMPFDRDQQFNASGSSLNCGTADRISKGIQAHSAPLGLSFLQGTNFPAAYRNGAVTALHGSWNRAVKTGAKLAYFPWNSSNQTPGAQIDLVTGWIDSSQNYWGRPVDMVPDAYGNLLISDDSSGTVYKLSYTPAANALSGKYQSVNQFRLFDTRTSAGGNRPLNAGETRSITAAGVGGIPSTATALVGNLTVANTQAGGYLSLYPGSSWPNNSSLNWNGSGQALANFAMVKLQGGSFTLRNSSDPGSAPADAIFDVIGYLDDTASGGNYFHTASPARAVDTRSGSPLASGNTGLTVSLASGTGAVPSGAKAALVNLTAVSTSAWGYLSVYPGGTALPPESSRTSTMNWSSPGSTLSHFVVVPLNASRQFSVYATGSSTHLLVDVFGYIDGDSSGSKATLVNPSRTYDNRFNSYPGTLVANTEQRLSQVNGLGGVPSGAKAAIVNITVAETQGYSGYLSVYPGNVSVPPLASRTSLLNWTGPNQAVANLVIVPVDPTTGQLRFLAGENRTHYILDIVGYL